MVRRYQSMTPENRAKLLAVAEAWARPEGE